jgi:hypothetical protein
MRRLPGLLLIAALAGAGCSGAARAASTPIANPCRLLTIAEASVALGENLVRSDVQHFGPIIRCRFFNASGDEPLWLDAADAETFEGLAHLPDVEPVSGIGDRALWQHNELATFLYVLKGGKMVSIGLPRTLSSVTPAIRQAAKVIADRM